MSLILSKKIYDIKEIPKKTGIYYFLDSNITNLKRLDFNTKDEIIIIKNYYKNNTESLQLIYLK